MNLKKKILIITPDIPSLNGKGYQKDAYYRVMAYKKNGYKIYIISHSLKINKIDNDTIQEFKKNGIIISYSQVSKFVSMYNLLVGLFFSNLPLQTLIYKSNLLKTNIINVLENFKPDLIHIITIRMTNEIYNYKKPVIIDFVDSMFLNFKERLKYSNWFLKFIINIELRRLRIYEKKIADLSKLSLIVSNKDSDHINSKNIFTLPIGMNLDFVKNIKNLNNTNRIIFTGNMNYFPNVQAIEWFIKNCWNNIKFKIKDCELYIVGRNPTKKILKLIAKEDGIFVTGEVKSVFDYIKTSSLAIAPMQSGSGMQNKIIEAMACKVPVVTTSLGLGDIGAANEKSIIIADDPNIYAQKIVNLLLNKSKRIKIGLNGKKYVFDNHDILSLNNIFINQVKSILR